LSDIIASTITPESSPAEIAALYDRYMETALAPQETPIAEMERWVCLCLALGSDLPIPVRFPRFLIVSAWASYGINKAEDQKVEFVTNYAAFLCDSDFLANHWEVRFDEELSQLITKAPGIDSHSPLDVSSEPFQTLRVIGHIPPRLLWCRMQLFNQFSRYLSNLVKSIATTGDSESILEKLFTTCRFAVTTQVKVGLVDKVVLDAANRVNENLSLRFNRYRASLFYEDPSCRLAKPLLAQFIEQVDGHPEQIRRLNKTNVPWHVDLIGEGATDVGGPGRELFSEVCL
jgi:hypothetical protein